MFDLEITNPEGILRDKAAQTTGAISNLELGTVFLVRRRSGRVVLGVKIARNRATFLGWNPQVGASRVQDDLENLRWGTDGDVGEI